MLQLSNSQINKLSDICSDVGIVSLASVVLPTLFNYMNVSLTYIGLIITIFFWLLSILILKK